MSQKSSFTVTATKIVTPQNKTIQVPTAGQLVTIITNNAIVIPTDGVTDTLILTDGYQITVQEDFADFNTAISATQITGS